MDTAITMAITMAVSMVVAHTATHRLGECKSPRRLADALLADKAKGDRARRLAEV